MTLCEADAWFYLSWIFFVFFVTSFLNSGSSNSSQYYKELKRPRLSPPAIVFPIAWTILYLLMSFAAAIVHLQGGWVANPTALGLFMGHMVINASWTPIFFRFKLLGFSVFWIILVDATAIPVFILFLLAKPLAGYLLIPYLAWIAFATYLNVSFYVLNKGKNTQLIGSSRSSLPTTTNGTTTITNTTNRSSSRTFKPLKSSSSTPEELEWN